MTEHDGRVCAVLVIGEKPDSAELIRERLADSKRKTYRVAYASNLKAGIRHLRTEPTDLVLLDLSLTDGLGGLHQLAAWGGNVPIIVLIEQADEALGQAALRSGAQDYLGKDEINPHLLEQVIRHALERHGLLAELHQREERYRGIVEDQTELICRYTPDFTLTFVNRAYSAQYGKRPEEMIGVNILGMIPVEDRDRAVAHVRRLTPAAPVATSEHRTTMPDGSTRWIQWTDRAFFDAAGQVVEYQGVGRDISEQKKLQSQLEVSAERYRLLSESMTDALFVAQLSEDGVPGRLIEVNDRACQYLGYTREELLQLTPAEIDDPQSASDNTAVIEKLKAGESVTFERVHIAKDGRRIPVEVHARFFNLQGVPAVIGLAHDITCRKSTEQRLRLLEAAVRHSEDAILLTDAPPGKDPHIVFVNEAFTRITGYEAAEIVGKRISTLERLYPSQDALSELRETVRAGHSFKGRTPATREDGSQMIIEWSIAPIHDEIGQITHYVAVLRDVTELVEAELALRQSEGRLKLALEAAEAGYWEWDFETGRTFWSERDFQLLGYDPVTDQASQGNWLRAIHPDDYEEALAKMKRIQEEGGRMNSEYRVVWPDGSIHWLQDLGETISDAHGQPQRMVGIVLDVTARKLAEAKLQQSADYMQALHEIDQVILEELSEEQIASVAIKQLRKVVQCQRAGVMILDAQTQEGRVLALSLEDGLSSVLESLPPSDLSALIRHINQPYTLIDTAEDAFPLVRPIRVAGIRSVLGVPLVVHQQRLGIILLGSSESNHFTPDHIQFALQIASEVAIGIQQARLWQQVRQQTQELTQRVRERTAELEQAKARVETILNSSSDGIVLLSPAKGIQQTNLAFDSLFACEPDAYFGQPLTVLVPPEAAPLLEQTIQAALDQNKVQRLEERVRRADGSLFEAEISLSKMSHNHEEQPHLICTIRDISERKQAQAALAEERNLLRTLIDTVPDFIYIKDLQHRFLLNNAAHARSLGNRSPAELLGKTDVELFPTDFSEQFHRDEDELFRTGKPLLDHEERALGVDGNLIWVSTTKVPLRNLQGEMIGLVGVGRDITLRKLNEEALRRSEEQLRESQQMLQLVLDSVPVRIFWKDRNSVYLGCNRLFAKDAGLDSPDDIIGKRTSDLPWAAEAAVYDADDRAIIESGISQLGREELLTIADGSRIWIHKNKLPLRDGRGNTIGILGAYIDISKRKLAEEALIRYSDEIHDLYNRAPCGYHSLDAEGVFVLINDTELNWLGYSRDEVIGKLHITDIMTPASAQIFQQNFPIFKERGWLKDLELELIRRDGSILPVLVNATAVRDERGAYLMSRSTLFDITDLKQAQDALRESEARYRLLIENVTDMICKLTPESIYTYVTPSSQTLIGYTPAELIGKSSYDYFHPDDIPTIREAHRAILTSPEPVTIAYRRRHKDGHYVWLETTSRILRDPTSGQPLEMVTSSRDITERKRAEEALKTALQKERELNDLKSRFVSMASHEFRTPLATIQAAVETLEAYHDRLDEAQRSLRFNKIREQVKHLTALMEDVLTIGRFEAGRLYPNFETVAIARLVAAIIDDFRHAHPERIIEYQPQGGDLELRADSNLLQQILTNLLENADKYSPREKPIYCTLCREENYVRIDVRDEGIGIPPDDQPHLFESFFRAKNVGTRPGTGLGLAIAKRGVELHKGTISFESELNRGTTFTVRLLIEEQPSDEPTGHQG